MMTAILGILRNSEMGNHDTFKQYIEQGKIQIDDEQKKKVMSITRESNPVLIYYLLKE